MNSVLSGIVYSGCVLLGGMMCAVAINENSPEMMAGAIAIGGFGVISNMFAWHCADLFYKRLRQSGGK